MNQEPKMAERVRSEFISKITLDLNVSVLSILPIRNILFICLTSICASSSSKIDAEAPYSQLWRLAPNVIV